MSGGLQTRQWGGHWFILLNWKAAMEQLTPIQTVIWTNNAKHREQIFLLRLLDVYGLESFAATLEEIATHTGFHRDTVVRCLKGLKDLGYIQSDRMYEKNGSYNLPIVKKCVYQIIIGKGPATD
jgi:hypothetical protein